MWKKRTLWLLKFLVGIGLVLVLYRHINQRQAIEQAFATANWVNVAIALILLLPNFFFQFLKWRYLLRHRYPEMPGRPAFQSLLFGATLGFVTPGNLGELARALFFEKYNRYVIAGLNVIDKIFNLLIFTTFGLVALNVYILWYFRLSYYVALPIAVLSALLLFFLWLVALHPQWVRSFLYGINTMLTSREKIKSFISCLDEFQSRHSLHMALLTTAWFFMIILQYHALLLAFTNVEFYQTFLGVSALLVTKMMLPISFGDLGIREGGAVFYFSYLGIPAAAAFNAAILIFVINFFIPALAGSWFVFKLKWEFRGKTRKSGEGRKR